MRLNLSRPIISLKPCVISWRFCIQPITGVLFCYIHEKSELCLCLYGCVFRPHLLDRSDFKKNSTEMGIAERFRNIRHLEQQADKNLRTAGGR